jgi:signal transduction histidine kinase
MEVNGQGIQDENLEKVFLPFFKEEYMGTGLGLAIVRKLVGVYNGEIKAYNDGGACFEFTLRDWH